MTDDTGDATIDLAVLGVAALVVYVLATKPAVRRTTWRLVKYVVFTAAPTYLWQEVTRAWAESGIRNSEEETWNSGKPAIIDA
jgi:hypothetical protein